MSQNKYIQLKQKSVENSPVALLNTLQFEQAINIACEMLDNKEWDESLQEYATTLLEVVRKKYVEKWNSSWRYDALLGYAYNIILKYDERYIAYKRAMKKANPPSPQLLVAMAGCCRAPGTPPITKEEAIILVKQAIRDVPYIEGIEKLKGLYKSLGDTVQQKHWETVLKNIKDSGPHLPSLLEIPKEEKF